MGKGPKNTYKLNGKGSENYIKTMGNGKLSENYIETKWERV